jgi:hypothetical protein
MSNLMGGLLHKRSRSVPELASKAYTAIDKLVDPQNEKQQDDCARYLQVMKVRSCPLND